MSVTELLQKAQFGVDAHGNRTAVVVDLTIWEELLTLLEDLEDADQVGRLRALKEESVEWDAAKNELRTAGKDVW